MIQNLTSTFPLKSEEVPGTFRLSTPAVLCFLFALVMMCGLCDEVYAQNEIVRVEIDSSIIAGARAKKAYDSGEHGRAIEIVSESLKQIDEDGKIRLKHEMFALYFYRGQSYAKLGEWQRAANDLKLATEYQPDSMSAANELAWLYATCPDAKIRNGKEALRLASLLEQRESVGWNEYDTIAAAYAEVGNFREAVRFQKTALNSVASFDEGELKYTIFSYSDSERSELNRRAIELADRLEMYRKKKPYRQPTPGK